jgi:alpha-beta hydrolase superfamily lysophospholipase
VDRTFAWISKNRRTVRDYELLPASHEAMILWVVTALMACRLANTPIYQTLTRGASNRCYPQLNAMRLKQSSDMSG